MLAKKAPFSQDRLLRVLQIVSLVGSFVVVTIFLRFYLVNSAQAFRADFERQNFIEMNRGETFLLARKLAALGKASQVACVQAKKGEAIFFEQGSSSCGPGIFQVQELVAEPNHQISIKFTLKLPDSLIAGLFWFLLVQGILAASLLLAQRRRQLLEYEHQFALAAQAEQVAHDIQSPLAILSIGKADQALRDRALRRLRQIVSHLRVGAKENEEPAVLGSLLAHAVKEKEAEFSLGLVPKIEIHWRDLAGNFRLAGNAYEWSRVFSNLFNNSIEAANPAGALITISVSHAPQGRLLIEIADQSGGIPGDVLLQLTKRGYTYGKAAGRGLGMYLARQFVESCGGSLTIESQLGAGTKVKILTPAQGAQSVVFVDDDFDLARAWRRVSELRGILLQHFSRPEDLLAAKAGLERDTPIYLDLKIGEDPQAGRALGELLYRDGFRELYVVSGSSPKTIGHLPWAKAILGKDPPWI